MISMIKRTLTKILPTKTISTVFGIGQMPTWQRHWATVAAHLLMILIMHISFKHKNASILTIQDTMSIVDVAGTFMVIAIVSYLLTITIGNLYCTTENVDTDSIVIDAFAGYFLTVGMSLIAIVQIRNYSTYIIAEKICGVFLPCAPWFSSTLQIIMPIFIPFATYRTFDHWKIWPASYFSSNFTGMLPKAADTLTSAAFSIMTIYFVSFTWFGLSAASATDFFILLFHDCIYKFNIAVYIAYTWYSNIDSMQILKATGIAGILEYFDIMDIPASD